MAKNHRSPAQTIALHGLMKEHLHQPGPGETYWVYDDGWSDKSVAAHVKGVNPQQVTHLRLQLFGPIGPKAGMASVVQIDEIKRDVIGLQDAVNKLRSAIEDLAKRHNQLCQTLSINRVADVRHLGKP